MFKSVVLLAALLGSSVSAHDVTYLFTFGDSYTQTKFNITGEKPSPANPIGNPAFPGATTAGGANWLGDMVTVFNTSSVLSYNFAYSGATVDAAIIASSVANALSLKDQVAVFTKNLVPAPEYAPWTTRNSIVGVWIGINDVGQSYSLANREDLYDLVMTSYEEQLQILYDAGLRRFFLLNVPPTDKTPKLAPKAELVAGAVAAYNTRVETLLANFKAAHPGACAVLVDTHVPFDEAINNPQEYGAPNATCVSSKGACLWWDTYHPSTQIQRLTGAQVAQDVGKPFACVDSVLCKEKDPEA